MAQGLSRVNRGLSTKQTGVGRTQSGMTNMRVPYVKPTSDPLHSTKNYSLFTQEQKMQSLKDKEQEQRAILANINEKAQSEVDDRTILEKWLNLDKNQGFVGDAMELLGRPMKFVQALPQDNVDPFKALTGEQKFTTEDFLKNGLGIDVSNMNGFGKFALTFGADIATDPLTYFDAPFKVAGKALKFTAGKVGTFARSAIETTERGQAFMKKFDVLKNEMSNKVKEVFNLYKNQEYKDFNAKVAGHANAVRASQEHSLDLLKKTHGMIAEDAEKIYAKKDAREYRALGLKRDASKEEVHAAYKSMIMQSLEQAPKEMTQGDVIKHMLSNRTEDGRGVFLISSTKAKGMEKVDKTVLQPMKEKFEKWLGRPVADEELTLELGKDGQGAFIKASKSLMDDVEKQMGRFTSIQARYAGFGLDHQTLAILNELSTTGKVALHLNDPIEKALFDKISTMFKGVGVTAHGAVGEVALTRRQLVAFLKNPENTDLVAHLIPYLQRRGASGTMGEALKLTPEERTELARLDGLAGDLPADQRTQFILDELEGKPQYKTMRDKLLEEQKLEREAAVKKMTSMANQTNNYALKEAYDRLAVLNQDYAKVSQKEARYQSAIDNINKRIEELEKMPFEGEKKIEFFKAEINKLKSELKEYKAAQDSARKHYKFLQKKSVKLNKEFDDLMNAVQTGKVVPQHIQDYPSMDAWLQHWDETIVHIENALAGGTAVDDAVLKEFKDVVDRVIDEYGIKTPQYTKEPKVWNEKVSSTIKAEKLSMQRYITYEGYTLNNGLRKGTIKPLVGKEKEEALKQIHYADTLKSAELSQELQLSMMDEMFKNASPSTRNIKLTRVQSFEVPQGGTAKWRSPEEEEAFNKLVNAKPGDILEDKAFQSTSAGFGYYGQTAAHGSTTQYGDVGQKLTQIQDEHGLTSFKDPLTGKVVHENASEEELYNLIHGESVNTTIKININAPKGSKMINMMNEFPDAVSMQEILLNRGSKLKVVNVRTIEEGGLEGAIELDVILMDGDYARIAEKETVTGEAIAQADKVKAAEEKIARKEEEIARNQVKLDNQLNAKKAAEGARDKEIAELHEQKKLIETKLDDVTQTKEQLGKEVTEAERKVKEPLAGENRVSQQQVDTVENLVYSGLNLNPEDLKVYAVPTNKAASNNIKVLNETMQELEGLAKEGFLSITPTKVPKALLDNTELRLMDITRNLEGIKQQIYATANLFGSSKLEDIAKEMNIDGYMRHIANQDTILWKRLEQMGADNPETARLISNFYKNGSKDQLTMNRKWLGSAKDINKSLGIDLFNTDPIEAMAVMLKIIPERFLAINLVEHALETGLIKELSAEETSKFLEAIKAGGSRKDAAFAALPKEYKFVDTHTINELERAFNFLKAAGAGDKDLQALSEALDKIKNKGIIHTGLYNKIIHYGNTLNEGSISEVLATLRKYFLNPWKKVALFSFGYHGRNFLSNLMNGYLAGMHPASYIKHFGQASADLYTLEREILPKIKKVMLSGKVELKTAEGQIKLINKVLTEEERKLYNEMMEMQSLGVLGSNKFSSDYYDMINSLHNVSKKQGIIRSKVKQISDASLKFGKLSDDASRIAAFRWAKTSKGSRHLEKIGLRTPEEFSKFAFFDFHDMSPFEEKYMKSIFPFYAWARKNFEFHVRNFAKQPKRYVRLNHFFKSAQDAAYNNPDEINKYDAANMLLPMWRKKDGKVVMMKISPTYLDLQDIASGNVLSRLNPLIKAPLEAITGQNTFTKRQMEGNLFSQFGTSMFGSPKNLLYALEGRRDKVDTSKLGLIGQRLLGITGTARDAAQGNISPETMLPSMFKATDTKANELKARENRVWMLNQQIEALRKQGRYVPTANQLFGRGDRMPHTNGRLRNMQTMSTTFAGRRRG